jgi:hypothetical protein
MTGKGEPEVVQSLCAPEPIDDLVELQHRMVRRWSRFAVKCIDRMQSGDFRLKPWVDAYGEFANATADDVLHALRALSRGAGGQET